MSKQEIYELEVRAEVTSRMKGNRSEGSSIEHKSRASSCNPLSLTTHYCISIAVSESRAKSTDPGRSMWPQYRLPVGTCSRGSKDCSSVFPVAHGSLLDLRFRISASMSTAMTMQPVTSP